MSSNLRFQFAAIPTPVSGLALGIASLGLGLENALPLHSFGQTLGALVALFILLCLVCKFINCPHLLRNDLRHPVVGSVLPTFAMAFALVAKTLTIWNALAGEILWLLAMGLYFLLMFSFVYYRLTLRDFHAMVPSWFVPFVGIILATVTMPHPKYLPFVTYLLAFGMISYCILLPVLLYRLFFSHEVADAAKPTIAIMAAPPSLALIGYLTIRPQPSLVIGSIFLGIALLMTMVVYLAFFRLLRLPFSAAFAAYTFPMAVGATAVYKVAEFFSTYPGAEKHAYQLSVIGVVEMGIASLIILYVCIRYFTHYAPKLILFEKLYAPSKTQRKSIEKGMQYPLEVLREESPRG